MGLVKKLRTMGSGSGEAIVLRLIATCSGVEVVILSGQDGRDGKEMMRRSLDGLRNIRSDLGNGAPRLGEWLDALITELTARDLAVRGDRAERILQCCESLIF